MATITRDPETDAAAEASLRRDLAACFRLCALHGWDDHVATHMSARLPDGTFLLNPFGLLFEEITASSLMRVDFEGMEARLRERERGAPSRTAPVFGSEG